MLFKFGILTVVLGLYPLNIGIVSVGTYKFIGGGLTLISLIMGTVLVMLSATKEV